MEEMIIPRSVILKRLTSPITLRWCGGEGKVGQAEDILCRDRYGCLWVDTQENIEKKYTLISSLPDSKALAFVDVAQERAVGGYHIIMNERVIFSGRKDDVLSKFRCGAFFIITRNNHLIPIRVNLTENVTAYQYLLHYD